MTRGKVDRDRVDRLIYFYLFILRVFRFLCASNTIQRGQTDRVEEEVTGWGLLGRGPFIRLSANIYIDGVPSTVVVVVVVIGVVHHNMIAGNLEREASTEAEGHCWFYCN